MANMKAGKLARDEAEFLKEHVVWNQNLPHSGVAERLQNLCEAYMKRVDELRAEAREKERATPCMVCGTSKRAAMVGDQCFINERGESVGRKGGKGHYCCNWGCAQKLMARIKASLGEED